MKKFGLILVCLVIALVSPVLITGCRTIDNGDGTSTVEFDPVMATFIYETAMKTLMELKAMEAMDDAQAEAQRQSDMQELNLVIAELLKQFNRNGMAIPKVEPQ